MSLVRRQPGERAMSAKHNLPIPPQNKRNNLWALFAIALFLSGTSIPFPSFAQPANQNSASKSGPEVKQCNDSSEEVIYGEDNRIDVYEAKLDPNLWPKVQNKLPAIMGVFYNDSIETAANTSNAQLKSKTTFKQGFELCDGTRFSDQYLGPACTAFLVAKDIVATAGHCVGPIMTFNPFDGEKVPSINSVKFISGFALTKSGNMTQEVGQFRENQVYTAIEILAHELDENTLLDYAVVRLDREVEGVTPLTLSEAATSELGNSFFVIGHPSGLPMKIATNGSRFGEGTSDFFVLSLDTFGGNSGSPVFDATTGEVEGILVRGAPDFVLDSEYQCYKPERCECVCLSGQCEEVDDGTCYGEDAIRTSVFRSFIEPHVAQ